MQPGVIARIASPRLVRCAGCVATEGTARSGLAVDGRLRAGDGPVRISVVPVPVAPCNMLGSTAEVTLVNRPGG